jgi:CBS domain-containing protein
MAHSDQARQAATTSVSACLRLSANGRVGRPPALVQAAQIGMTFGPSRPVSAWRTLCAMKRNTSVADGLMVADLMTLDPVVIGVDAAIEEAERLMRERHISGLPVVDEQGALVGVISQTDVLEDGGAPMAILLRRKPSGLRVGELMSSPAVTVAITAPLVEGARLMRDNRIHRVVAVDEHGRPVGVLSASDFVSLYADS